MKKRHIARGKILSDMEDFNWGNAYEGGHMAHIDNMIMAHTTPEGTQGTAEYLEEAIEASLDPELEYHTGHPHLTLGGDKGHDAFGPMNNNYHIWMRALKKAIDPNGAAEANYYITPDDEYKDGYFKVSETK